MLRESSNSSQAEGKNPVKQNIKTRLKTVTNPSRGRPKRSQWMQLDSGKIDRNIDIKLLDRAIRREGERGRERERERGRERERELVPVVVFMFACPCPACD